MDKNLFLADNKGKCMDCGKPKPLDEMVAEKRGNYHCIDCEVVRYNQLYDYDEIKEGRESRMSRAIKWCFG